MATEGYKRKISAILSADVEGYSKLMQDDEAATVRTIEAYRETVIIAIKQHRGRTIDSPGDNILSEFASVVDAVQCAVEIQQIIKAKNADLPQERKMEFRIGINLGDVIEEGDRIYGDGINIASRIEGLADPGGICISSSAYEQIESKLALGYEDIGRHEVRNIAKPVHVYRIPTDSKSLTETERAESVADRKWRNIAIAAIAVIVVGAGLIVARNYIERPAPSQETAEPAAAGKPSIAVLPFDNMSGDPEQEYFSDGISEDILDGLARNPGLIVKARTSSFRFKGEKEDIRRIGEMLDATHVVEGSVRKSGNRIRVTAQLIDANKDMHIWSNKFDRELTDVFAVQDEISSQILKALNVHLTKPPDRHMRTDNMKAYDAYLLGRYQMDLGEWDKALISFEKAVSLDPGFADAYGLLSYIHHWYIATARSIPSERLPKIRSLIDKALAIDPHQPHALAIQVITRSFAGHSYQDAVNQYSDLVRRYPSDNIVLWIYSVMLDAIGRFDLSLQIANKAMVTDPVNPARYFERGHHLILSGQREKARQDFERMGMLGSAEPGQLAWVAFLERDTQALKIQLNRGKSAWGFHSNWYLVFAAAVSTLEGNYRSAKEVLSPLWQDPSIQFFQKSWMAALEGDLDRALGYYSQALRHSEFNAFWQSQAPTFIRLLFPGYRTHPKYQEMLKDVGLDEESIAKLKIPPLPF